MQPEGRYGLASYYHYPCYMCLCERTSYAPRAWFNFRPVNEAETSDAHLKFSVNSILGMHSPSAPHQFSREVQRTVQHENSPQLPSRSSIPAAKTQSRFEPYEKPAHTAPKKEMKDAGLLDTETKETAVQSHKPVGKKRRKRTIFTSEQLKKLEDEFDKQQYLVGAERQQMAAALNLSETQVKIWFQNRRIKWRKENFHLYNEI